MTPEMWLLLANCLFEVLVSVALGVGLYLLARRAQLSDTREAQRTERMDTLEETVIDTAREVVNKKFDLLAMEFKGLIGSMNNVIEGLQKRLERGDQVFREQAENHQEIIVRAEHRENALREWSRDSFGSREELAAAIAALQQLQIKVAKFEERLGRMGSHE